MTEPYYRKINYYETDQMGIVHHSNYPRILEECRLDYMEKIGFPYKKMEEMGIIIPVLEIHCYYRQSIKYDDEVYVYPNITKLTPVRFEMEYKMYDKSKEKLLHTAVTAHCFVDSEFRPMNLKRRFPEVYEMFRENIKTD